MPSIGFLGPRPPGAGSTRPRLVPLALGLALLALPAFPAPASAQVAPSPPAVLSPEHRAMDFLVGEWHTRSEFNDGRVGEGRLSYQWVLGGEWMRVEFLGDHPDGILWEAHVMQRWNPASEEYEAWVFGGPGAPLRYRGSVPGPGRFRVEVATGDGSPSGIDYQATEGGGVVQENWTEREGERIVTLRTVYRRR